MSDDAPEQPDGGTFTARDIQDWADSLTPREAAMLAHLVGDREFRAAVDALGAAAEAIAGIARRLADKGQRNESVAVRSVVGTILRVQRQAIEAGRAHAGLPMRETMQ